MAIHRVQECLLFFLWAIHRYLHLSCPSIHPVGEVQQVFPSSGAPTGRWKVGEFCIGSSLVHPVRYYWRRREGGGGDATPPTVGWMSCNIRDKQRNDRSNICPRTQVLHYRLHIPPSTPPLVVLLLVFLDIQYLISGATCVDHTENFHTVWILYLFCFWPLNCLRKDLKMIVLVWRLIN